jgi:nitroreductase
MSDRTLPDVETTAALPKDAIDALQMALAHRRSLGLARLKPDPVPRAYIERALEAADWAPSHGDTEPWRFTVYTGASRSPLGEAFAEAYRQMTPPAEFKQAAFDANRARADSAPVWIALGVAPALRPDGAMRMTMEEELMAAASAVQNLHLMASAQGLAGMWLSKGVSIHSHVAGFVGLEPPARLLGFFILGWPNVPWPEGERRPLTEKVRWAE